MRNNKQSNLLVCSLSISKPCGALPPAHTEGVLTVHTDCQHENQTMFLQGQSPTVLQGECRGCMRAHLEDHTAVIGLSFVVECGTVREAIRPVALHDTL